MTRPATRPVVSRKLSSLKPHPRQDALFAPLPESALQALADDLQANGLMQPVEILPDGTIICGHQRVAAARLLGWTKIDCIVRDDLAAAGAEAVERRLIEDNLNRRQLTELDIARLYRGLKEQRRVKRSRNGKGDWRDSIAKRFNVSGRTLERWAQVLDTDPAVQQAVSDRRITLSQAILIVALPDKTRQKVAAGLAAGKPLAGLLPRMGTRIAKPDSTSFEQLLPRIDKLIQQLPGTPLPAYVSTSERQALDRDRRVLRDLVRRLDASEERQTPVDTPAPPRFDPVSRRPTKQPRQP